VDNDMTSYFDVILKWIDIRRLRGVQWRIVIVIFSVQSLGQLLFWYYGTAASSSMIIISACFFISIITTIILLPSLCRRPHDIYWGRSQLMLSYHRCPNCEYSLIGLECNDDHFTVCPECSISWKLPEEIKEPPSYRKQKLMKLLFTHHVMKLDDENLRDICPACEAVIGNTNTNVDGNTTCPKCEASWKWPEQVKVSKRSSHRPYHGWRRGGSSPRRRAVLRSGLRPSLRPPRRPTIQPPDSHNDWYITWGHTRVFHIPALEEYSFVFWACLTALGALGFMYLNWKLIDLTRRRPIDG